MKSPEQKIPRNIDQFVAAKLERVGVEPAPLTDDHAFLRRIALDTVGVIPSPAEIRRFFADPRDVRRVRAIDRLLADPRWADHWVSYWQDVLAENPGILKPMLNNTGPFRWWLYESLVDNKPIDRMVTELVMMEGSKHYGGPAGFSMATQNDVPMAAKAHTVAQAFLAIEMKCARCHDAPFHDATQKQLFGLSAMLGRAAAKVPKTSSVPLSEDEIAGLIVKVSLKPGSKVDAAWPFEHLIAGDVSRLPPGVLRDPDDPRERVAALITWPANERFAQVIVNRVWKRYLGLGLVEPVDDWQDAEASHPELLRYLARELVVGGYDMKHVSRLILNSRAYQRTVLPRAEEQEHGRLFARATRRRMTAEQLVDSLFVAAGKSMGSEPLTLDPEGRRPVKAFLNLGTPTRAWQFTSLSNERDRPSLSLPRAAGVVDLLKVFGWRETRQAPLTVRDDTPIVQQPAMLAGGVVALRATRLSEDSALTELCLQAESPEAAVREMFMRLLTREPTREEQRLFIELLQDGFQARIVEPKVGARGPAQNRRTAVSWSNHLSPEASKIKMEIERAVRAGDPPTARLEPDWRERAETLAWVLINSPEFVFVP